MKKKLKKCENCKWAGQHNKKTAFGDDHCLQPYGERVFKVTTNSKNTTHCDKHEFVSQKHI